MLAGIIAARNGCEVTILEKNEKCGKKLFITGKGRCNFTNASDREEILQAILTNPKFMYSSLNQFSNYDVMGLFDELGCPCKVERGNRVFPSSDHSSDVIGALLRECKRLGVKICYNTVVKEVHTHMVGEVQCFSTVVTTDHQKFSGDALILATGGLSYASTGSTGDGYHFAKELGHHIVGTRPGLVPFVAKEEYCKKLMGLSLRNVAIRILDGEKELYSDFGEMLFTHFGVSGPTLISASSVVGDVLSKRPLKLFIDLKPALSEEQLDERILRDFEECKNKNFNNSLDGLLPQKLIPIVIMLTGIDEYKKVNSITVKEREKLISVIKNFPLTLISLRGYNEAIITRGGVDVKEVSPKTMESKLVKGIFFAGEVLDVDAVTGGYNLQIAWSTAYAAAMGASAIKE